MLDREQWMAEAKRKFPALVSREAVVDIDCPQRRRPEPPDPEPVPPEYSIGVMRGCWRGVVPDADQPDHAKCIREGDSPASTHRLKSAHERLPEQHR